MIQHLPPPALGFGEDLHGKVLREDDGPALRERDVEDPPVVLYEFVAGALEVALGFLGGVDGAPEGDVVAGEDEDRDGAGVDFVRAGLAPVNFPGGVVEIG